MAARCFFSAVQACFRMRASAASTSPRRPSSPRTDVVIVAAGLVAAIVSGVAAYRTAGTYGDGFLNYGLYRASERGVQAPLVIRKVVTDQGLLLHYVFDGGTRRLTELRVMPGPGGPSEVVRIDLAQGIPGRFDLDRTAVAWDDGERKVRIGFSQGGAGRLDTWQFWGADGQLAEVRVSRRADGAVDRWEYYDQGQLARVEEDANRDGRVDHWQIYDAGILLEEAFDRDDDGRPDGGL